MTTTDLVADAIGDELDTAEQRLGCIRDAIGTEPALDGYGLAFVLTKLVTLNKAIADLDAMLEGDRS